ncbi:MAG: sigma-54-dependent transcriptional regulator [bacterium]
MKKIKKILIVDDNKSALRVLKAILEEDGYTVFSESSPVKALEAVEKTEPGVILLDLKMPEMDGMELYGKIREIDKKAVVIIMTAYGNIESAVQAMKSGVENYLQKPLNFEELKITIAKIFEKIELRDDVALLKGQLEGKNVFENMIGKSKKMKNVFYKIENIAKTDSTVLITGESGTGKEMVSKAIHNLSRRRENKMVSINLAAIPEGLQESELFGYVKGAFTGAYTSKPGKFEAADNGTVFLDEIGNITHKVQVKLLRVIENMQVEPLGGNKLKSVNVRIISATNSDLKNDLKTGAFREDLYYRLNVISVHLPPLRERKADIPLLAMQFLKEICLKNSIAEKELSDDAMEMLIEYKWPGNIRELRNVIEEGVVTSGEKTIKPDDLNFSYVGVDPGSDDNDEDLISVNMPLYDMEKKAIINALIKSKGNQTHAADMLGISRKVLMNKIEKHKITDFVPVRTKRKKVSE